jgi:hypothetical protein
MEGSKHPADIGSPIMGDDVRPRNAERIEEPTGILQNDW